MTRKLWLLLTFSCLCLFCIFLLLIFFLPRMQGKSGVFVPIEIWGLK